MTTATLHGILFVDKPAGPTSHDVVGVARRALGERRIGHTGTLDPFASGLLVLCVGQATRLAEYLTGMDKTYEAVAILGTATDSGDADGEVVAVSDAWGGISLQAVEAALVPLRGEIRQIPPALSAKKVRGVPAHRRVRRGEDVALEPQTVTVHQLEVMDFDPPRLGLRVRCSSGTYVRSLARDLGEALGVGAHLTALRRTAIGPFGVEEAIPLTVLADGAVHADALLSPLGAMVHLPHVEVDEARVVELVHGRVVDVPGMADAPVVVAGSGTVLVAVGAVRGGRFLPRKVLAHG